MAIATLDVHGGKAVWASEGGAELPITNMAATTGMTLSGSGAFSLDRTLGIRVPTPAAVAVLGAAAGVVTAEERSKPAPDTF